MKKQSAGWPPLLVLAVMAVMAVPVLAGEVPVKNDSLVDGGSAAIQAGFVAHEQAAAWLTSPCNGHIVAVQIFWRSVLETTPPSLEDSITVYAAGTFPNPGAVLAFLDSPVLEDGYMNEFRYLDEQQTEPIYVPIQAGQTFIVSFKFAQTPGLTGASVCTDVDGCQAAKNGIFAIPPSAWKNGCSLGIRGDFVIRAVVDCAQTSCPGDVDLSGHVDLVDLAALLSKYHKTSGATWADGDFDGDGDVDLSDLAALLANYGKDCP